MRRVVVEKEQHSGHGRARYAITATKAKRVPPLIDDRPSSKGQRMKDAHTARQDQSGWSSIWKNLGWLLGGKGVAAICSLIYLAILARSLGVKDFGHFSLIFGTALALVEIAGFQTWQMVVRYGTPHVAKGHWDAFGRVAMVGALIDFLGGVLGCVVAWVAIVYFGPELDLNPAYSQTALYFVCALSLSRVSAPLGIMRTLDRYDLAVAAGSLTPVARVFAATAIWLSGASVEKFLLAWAAIEIATAVLYWTLARRLEHRAVRLTNAFHIRRMRDENPGVLKFLGVTYASTSLYGAMQQGPLLAVGYFLGTSAAGVYRIADQLAKGLGRLASLSAQALYPEVNRQKHLSPHDQFRKLVKRINVTVLIAGALLVMTTFAIGGLILEVIGGADFARGGPILIPLVLAASLELAGVSYESVLHAHGKAHYQLFARFFTLVTMSALIVWFVAGGPVWVGWAVAAGATAGYLLTSAIVWQVIAKSTPRSEIG